MAFAPRANDLETALPECGQQRLGSERYAVDASRHDQGAFLRWTHQKDPNFDSFADGRLLSAYKLNTA
jgi:hypothetical protein